MNSNPVIEDNGATVSGGGLGIARGSELTEGSRQPETGRCA